MGKWIFIGMMLCASEALAETLIAARTVRSRAIITAEDVVHKDIDVQGALISADQAIGLEARVVLYAGRPIRPSQIGPAAIIERNQIVRLIYHSGALKIVTDARSLGRGGVGDYIRVMNLSSRTTVGGIVDDNGAVIVGH